MTENGTKPATTVTLSFYCCARGCDRRVKFQVDMTANEDQEAYERTMQEAIHAQGWDTGEDVHDTRCPEHRFTTPPGIIQIDPSPSPLYDMERIRDTKSWGASFLTVRRVMRRMDDDSKYEEWGRISHISPLEVREDGGRRHKYRTVRSMVHQGGWRVYS